MHKNLIIGASLLLGACSASGLFGGGGFEPTAGLDTPGTAQPPRLDARGLAVYLELMRMLVDGDAVEQAETFASIEYAAEIAPTTTNRLKLALAHAVPSHPASDAARAAEELAALLADADALLPGERAPAQIHLEEVEQRMILDATAEQLRQEAAEARARQDVEETERLQAALRENQRLRSELEEAQAKLDAITSIEQSIRERENNAE